MSKFLISAVLIAAAAMAAPAAAQYGNTYNRGYNYGQGYNQGQAIERELYQIRQRIDQAARRGTITRNEANRLFRHANQIDRLLDVYRHNGLKPREIQDLQWRLQNLRQQLRFERRDGRRDYRRW